MSNQKLSQPVRKATRVNVNDPSFCSSVSVSSKTQQNGVLRNLKKWCDLIAYLRWMPDIFYDLITPETGAIIRLGLDQRVELRCLARFKSTYITKTRGGGKTMAAMLYSIHTCIFYPNVQVGLTAQTRENSAKLIKDKWEEFVRAFPLLKEEVYSTRFSKDVAEIEFHNGSKIINLANQQSSKGSHLQRGIVDEDNLTDEETYLDVLEPIFSTVPRRTVGKNCLVDPKEMNGSIVQITSSGFRGSSAFYRCLKKYENMLNLKGEMCLGASWRMGVHYGRGATKAEILKKKDTNSAISFDMNYEAVWTGAADDCLVSISKLMQDRNLSMSDVKPNKNYEYVFGVDVARSDNSGNNQTSVAVLKIIRRKNNRVQEIHLTNIIPISGNLDFEAQAVEIKRLRLLYEPIAVVVDENGLGRGLTDSLVKEQIDPMTGESLGCLDTLNSERIPEISGSPKIVFCYMAQKYDNESIPMFMDSVEVGKLRLLPKIDLNAYSDMTTEQKLPFLQTDFFVEEVSNLKLKHLNNGGLSIDRVTKKMNKDRFSSVQYGLWYILRHLDEQKKDDNVDEVSFLSEYIMW